MGGEDHPTLADHSTLVAPRLPTLPVWGPFWYWEGRRLTLGHSVAFQTCGPHPADEEEERSSRLKALLSDYFEKEPAGEQAERGCEEEEEEEEGLGDAKVSESAFIGSRFGL